MLQAVSTASLQARRGFTRSEISAAFYQLSTFLSVGLPLIDAIDDIATSGSSHAGQRHWARIGQSVKSGNTLSEALISSGLHIEKSVVAIIKSGEANGQLGEACESVSDYLRWHLELRERIVTLLVYPLFSLCVLVVVSGFLFMSVVPSIEGFLLSSGEPLAWHTLALLQVSAWFSEYLLIAVYLGLGCAAGLFLIMQLSPGVRWLVDASLLKLPGVGAVLTDLLLSRYAHCIAQLYSSGIALEISLQLAEQTVDNTSLRADLARVRHKMVSGKSLAQALQTISSLPSMFTRLVAMGERSGKLSPVLVQLASQQSRAVEASINRMEQLIGPVLLLCVGSVLLWIVVSMLGPVYNMAIVSVVGAS